MSMFIVALLAAFADPGSAPPTPEEAAAWPLIAEDGVFQRRRGPLTLARGDAVSVWTAALPQAEHAETLGVAFRRFEIDCPRSRIRRAEGFNLEPGAAEPVATDAGDALFSYPGAHPSWVGSLLSEVCSTAD